LSFLSPSQDKQNRCNAASDRNLLPFAISPQPLLIILAEKPHTHKGVKKMESIPVLQLKNVNAKERVKRDSMRESKLWENSFPRAGKTPHGQQPGTECKMHFW